MPSLRDRAAAALEKQKALEAERAQHDRDVASVRTVRQFQKDFGFEPESVDGHYAMDEGIVLKRIDPVTTALSAGWALMGVCPHCSKDIESVLCHTLADIGAQMAHFVPSEKHRKTCDVIDVTKGLPDDIRMDDIRAGHLAGKHRRHG